ncbi:MAG TPA: tetratricopeptide repeat protein [Blastocatellia bacterium]|nr:tetratricopeptide repeat protein [Blastocatellia bacterium]
MVSQQLSHYRIIGKLGVGGMGEVFLAEDMKLERKVAIKMLPAKSLTDGHAKKRLFREAKAAATLDHPNICAIHEVSEEGDSLFIVMQYVDGATLSKKIKDNPLSPAEVVDIGIQVAGALVEAHSHGIIHRDVKPQNVIITPRGQVKVLDFGLAKQVRGAETLDVEARTESRLTEEGQVVGTAGYMSPEQLRGENIDARSDLFSLGVTLYECATGKPAFSGNSVIEISSQVLQVEPQRPSRVNQDVPRGLEEIILKAMAKDIQTRYQSADALLEDLRKLRAALTDGSGFRTRAMTGGLNSLPMTVALTGALQKTRVKFAGLVVLISILGIWGALQFLRPSPHQPSKQASSWYERGTDEIRAGTYYQASKNLEQSVENDPSYALAHARLAEAYVEIDNTDKAMSELLRALSLAPDRSALSTVDAMYLDGIAATVRRDFAAAIDYYGKIADRSSSAEKSNAYVDLGRAYEKSENIDKAIEYYSQAAKLNSQSAPAFLRLGILYGRRQDLKDATDAFDKAEAIYGVMSNQEGQAEVLFQRGALSSKMRKLADAKAQLEKALEISKGATNKYQYVKTQLQLSSVYEAEGNTERAKEIATEAINAAQSNKIRSLETSGLMDLGFLFLSRGEFDEAGKRFRQALDYAQADKARRAEARARYLLGSLNLKQGNLDDAISFLQQANEFYKSAGYRLESSNALLLTARANRVKGQYETALQAFEQVRDIAKQLGDPAREASSLSSIALTLGELERYTEALARLDESLKINESLGAKVDAGYDQMNRSGLLWQLGRYQEARLALDQASSIANRPEDSYKLVLARVYLTESQMALSERRFAEARSKGQQALDVAGSQAKDLACPAKYTTALAQALSGGAQQAQKLCEDAVALARDVNSPRQLSSALLALAEVFLLRDDARGALSNALQAQTMFSQSAQRDSEWRALLIAARASQLAGDKSAAQSYASRAESLCSGLWQVWGADAYKSYLRRPDIQNYRKQLALILSGK